MIVGLIVWLLRGELSQLILFLPGLIALPVFALVPSIGGKGVPLSLPADAAKSAGRGLNMILVMMISFAQAGLTTMSRLQRWFWWLVLGETMVAIGIYSAMRLALAKVRWPSAE